MCTAFAFPINLPLSQPRNFMSFILLILSLILLVREWGSRYMGLGCCLGLNYDKWLDTKCLPHIYEGIKITKFTYTICFSIFHPLECFSHGGQTHCKKITRERWTKEQKKANAFRVNYDSKHIWKSCYWSSQEKDMNACTCTHALVNFNPPADKRLLWQLFIQLECGLYMVTKDMSLPIW